MSALSLLLLWGSAMFGVLCRSAFLPPLQNTKPLYIHTATTSSINKQQIQSNRFALCVGNIIAHCTHVNACPVSTHPSVTPSL